MSNVAVSSPPREAELSRKLEEREVMMSQLQRSKNSFGQNVEELKKQLDEENKVGVTSLHLLKVSYHAKSISPMSSVSTVGQ